MKILKYAEVNMGYSFVHNIVITESNSSDDISQVLGNLNITTDLSELKDFIQNLNIIVTKLNPENSLLISIVATLVAYNESKDDPKIKKDCRNILEELKLNGTGNGTVRTIVEFLSNLKNITSQIYNTTDLFNSKIYPLLNSISVLIDKYEINLDTIVSNTNTLNISLNALIAKNGLPYVLNIINTNNVSIDDLDKQSEIIKEII